jgi:chaperone required for assembly of F1-ATPase
VKRFWKAAELKAEDTGWAITLDGRGVRTPMRQPLIVPGEALARRITAEWDAQGEEIDPRTMPMTGFANATIDRVLPAVGDFRGQIAAYAESDLLCYRADGPDALVGKQAEAWDPLLNWAAQKFSIEFAVTSGIIPVDQAARTLSTLRAAVEGLDPWSLAGVATVVQIGGSLVGALAMLHGHIAAEELFEVTCVDERWQAELWGEDAEASERLGRRGEEFLVAAEYCALAVQA